MKQTTAQQFANIFGMYVAKDESDMKIYAHEEKPNMVYLESYWFSHKKVMDITKLISDADSLDWNVLIEPQEEFLNWGENKCTNMTADCHARRISDNICMNGIICKPVPFDEKNAPIYIEGEFYMTSTGEIRTPKREEPVPFDENNAPNGYNAVKCIDDVDCCLICPFLDSGNCDVINCSQYERPDRTDAYFVKKEDEK